LLAKFWTGNQDATWETSHIWEYNIKGYPREIEYEGIDWIHLT